MSLKCQAKFGAMSIVFGVTLLPGLGCNRSGETDAPVRPTRPEITAQPQIIAKPEMTVQEDKPIATEEKSSTGFYTVEHYGEDRDVEEDLKITIARATAEKKRILLQVGGEWCGWCKLLTGFIEKSEPIRSSLEKNFLLMKVTYTKDQPNEAFLSKYPKIVGYPHLFVLDSDGSLLHSQDTTPLEEGGKSYNEGKIMSFLQEWKKAD
jgi:Thioredoxin-like